MKCSFRKRYNNDYNIKNITFKRCRFFSFLLSQSQCVFYEKQREALVEENVEQHYIEISNVMECIHAPET